MINRLLSYWNSLNSGQRRTGVIFGIGILTVFLSVAIYLTSSRKELKTEEDKKSSPISLEPKLLEKSQFLESQKELTRRDEKVAELQKKLEEISQQKNGQVVANPQQPVPMPVAGQPVTTAALHPQGQSASTTGAKPSGSKQPVPPPPSLPQSAIPPPPSMPSTAQGQPLPPPETEIGDITIVAGSMQSATPKDVGGDKKKENTTVYLPPSFMEATLLSGLDAPTASEAKGNPVPVLLKVKTPAVLPNSVKANLKGCFVIADGRGNLATERAELLLVSLSCLDRKGQAVIDQKVKGFVVDEDGKIGLRGKVVAKMGSMVARSMIAGFFGGVGDVLKASATTTSVSALGTTQSINANDLAVAGVGNGLSNGFKEIQKFYMELARQTLPVIEVGATKPVTLVVSEGTNLEIKKISKGGVK
ncbi:conjugal transfer protein TraB [Geotalea uraniireducens]|uniref:Conjugal transfer protein TraB n=1 Tax=Geotalea uraniireducens TaxID=351604 RepID=A0ABN6VMT8_9BACT|nr:TraB/VirB10 family protein [Geotalea uraniireducens]BDV41513.1 conjugal transfer protein TraB [Geotalea uraniireducens]